MARRPSSKRPRGRANDSTFPGVIKPIVPASSDTVGATLTVLCGTDAGKILFVEREGGTIGREEDVEFLLSDASISRRHARLALREGRFWLADLESLNGTLVDERRVEGEVPLPDSCRVQLGTHTVLQYTALDGLGVEAMRKLSATMLTDPLTGAGNRLQLQQRLEQEQNFARRHGTLLGLLLLDLDHFKRVNDEHGHPAGDRVLAEVASAVIEAVRAEDAVFRYGGEEFCILIRGLTPAELGTMAERIRDVVERLRIHAADATISLTTSIGIAMLGDEDDDDLLLRADQALYEAKRRGRNQVFSAPMPRPEDSTDQL